MARRYMSGKTVKWLQKIRTVMRAEGCPTLWRLGFSCTIISNSSIGADRRLLPSTAAHRVTEKSNSFFSTKTSFSFESGSVFHPRSQRGLAFYHALLKRFKGLSHFTVEIHLRWRDSTGDAIGVHGVAAIRQSSQFAPTVLAS